MELEDSKFLEFYWPSRYASFFDYKRTGAGGIGVRVNKSWKVNKVVTKLSLPNLCVLRWLEFNFHWLEFIELHT